MNSQEVDFLVHFICESDAIESIRDDPWLIKAQIQNRRRHGHVGALLSLDKNASQKVLLTSTLIQHTQSLIVARQHQQDQRKIAKKHRGHWRDVDVWIVKKVGGLIVDEIEMPPPTDVPLLMNELANGMMHWQATCATLSDAEKITAIARFHYDYLRIHPFVDGNGRSGRALVYYLYRFAGLTPFIFTAADRHATYYQCFRDPADMVEYFRQRTI